jgi:hypothetical protein
LPFSLESLKHPNETGKRWNKMASRFDGRDRIVDNTFPMNESSHGQRQTTIAFANSGLPFVLFDLKLSLYLQFKRDWL